MLTSENLCMEECVGRTFGPYLLFSPVLCPRLWGLASSSLESCWPSRVRVRSQVSTRFWCLVPGAQPGLVSWEHKWGVPRCHGGAWRTTRNSLDRPRGRMSGPSTGHVQGMYKCRWSGSASRRAAVWWGAGPGGLWVILMYLELALGAQRQLGGSAFAIEGKTFLGAVVRSSQDSKQTN